MEPINVLDILNAAEKVCALPEIKETSSIFNCPAYPEALLQETENANRYYTSFQRYEKQFIKEIDHKLIRWSPNSHIYKTSNEIVTAWNNTEGELSINATGASGIDGKDDTDSKNRSAANSLFSWSSSESYVRAKRKQLKEKKVYISKVPDQKANIDEPIKKKKPSESMITRINRNIEEESKKFIHARIQKIKDHHNEVVSRQIDDRKRRDIEEHLHRLKLKEENYEKSLELNQNRQGFFGSLFGINNNNNPINKDHSESDKKRFSFFPTLKKDKDAGVDINDSMKQETNTENKEISTVADEQPNEQLNTTMESDVESVSSKDKHNNTDDNTGDDNLDKSSVPVKSLTIEISPRTTPNIPSNKNIISTILTPKKKSDTTELVSPIPEPVTICNPVKKSPNSSNISKFDEFDEFSIFQSAPSHSSASKEKSNGHSFIPLQKEAPKLVDFEDLEFNNLNAKTDTRKNSPIEDLVLL